jgi:hypothetical protein
MASAITLPPGHTQLPGVSLQGPYLTEFIEIGLPDATSLARRTMMP